MPVAEGQVVKVSELWPGGVDRVGSLLLISIEAVYSTMSQPDADQSGFGRLIVHPGGGVVEGATMLEWGREQDGGGLLNCSGLGFGMRVDVVRQVAPSNLVPESIGLIWIMVPWQQVPLNGGVSPHTLHDLVAGAGGGSCMVINITRDQYVAHVVLFGGESADARDRLQAGQL